MNTQIIAIANQKGGVGKATTCANLGIGLAQAGKKVLLIDGDPQGSLTISLGNPQPDKLPFTLSDAMGKILMDHPIRPGEGILHHAEGVDLMPADIQLSGMEVSLVNAMSRETILRQYLDTLKGQYCLGMLEAVGEVFPEAKYQRCVVHFYRNIFSVVPKSKVKNVAKMLKAIHAQESKKASREKAAAVVSELKAMKLPEAAKKVEAGIEETLTYCDFPSEHWVKIRTNNVIERMNREIRRRTRVVGAFPDGNSVLMLVCTRLRHAAGTQWGCKKYMNMKHLETMEQEPQVG